MTRNTLSLFAALLVGVVTAPVAAQSPEGTDTLSAAAAADDDTSEEAAAAEDDILQVLDLPIATVELIEEDGLSEAQVSEALESAAEAGLPASEATEILEGESEAIKTRGKKKGFGVWVARRVAAGERGKVIRQLAKMRGQDGDEPDLSEEEKAKLKEAFQARKEAEKERRERIHARRDVMRAEGKRLKMRGIEKHREREAEMAQRRLERLKALQDKGVEHPELEAKIAQAEKRAARAQGREGRAEMRRKEAGADVREERKEFRGERKEAIEARKEAIEARKEAKEELREQGKGPKGKGPKGKGPKGEQGPKGGPR